MAMIRSMSQGWPIMWTGMMALVFSVIRFSTSSGSSWKDAVSRSARTGSARADRMEAMVPGSV